MEVFKRNQVRTTIFVDSEKGRTIYHERGNIDAMLKQNSLPSKMYLSLFSLYRLEKEKTEIASAWHELADEVDRLKQDRVKLSFRQIRCKRDDEESLHTAYKYKLRGKILHSLWSIEKMCHIQTHC